ncbi:hypothetical protein V6N13_134502 [Hibiscus sabdariffa]
MASLYDDPSPSTAFLAISPISLALFLISPPSSPPPISRLHHVSPHRYPRLHVPPKPMQAPHSNPNLQHIRHEFLIKELLRRYRPCDHRHAAAHAF